MRADREPAQVPGRGRPRLPDDSVVRRRRSRAARRSAFAWRAQIGSGLDRRACTCSTNPRSACTRATTAGCIEALEHLRDLGNTALAGGARQRGDREAPTADRLRPRRAASTAAKSWLAGTPAKWRRRRGRVTGPYLSGNKGIPSRSTAACHRGETVSATAAPRSRRRRPGQGASARHQPRRGGAQARSSSARAAGSKSAAAPQPAERRCGDPPSGTLLAVVTGVSGAGKSSLVEDVLYKGAPRSTCIAPGTPAPTMRSRASITSTRSSASISSRSGTRLRSTPATYTGVFDPIRELYARTPRGEGARLPPAALQLQRARRPVRGVRGDGRKSIEMHFLPDVWVECDACRGQALQPETLGGARSTAKPISDVLDMSCAEAARAVPRTSRRSAASCKCWSTSASTTSSSVSRRRRSPAARPSASSWPRNSAAPDTGRTLYLLDEPTTGLHFEDLAKLLEVLHRLVDLGNTVVVIEHNLDIIKTPTGSSKSVPRPASRGPRWSCRARRKTWPNTRAGARARPRSTRPRLSFTHRRGGAARC